MFGDAAAAVRYFTLVLPISEYCSPEWGSAADCNFNLLDALVAQGSRHNWVDLPHRRRVADLCVLHKQFFNENHLLHSTIPSLVGPRRATRGGLSAHRYALEPVRCRTSQFHGCFSASVFANLEWYA